MYFTRYGQYSRGEFDDGISLGPPCGQRLNCSWNAKEQETGRDGLAHKPTTQNFLEVEMESEEFLH